MVSLAQSGLMKLYEAAKESVGILEGRRSILLEIKECFSAIDHSDHFIEKLEDDMADYLKQIPYSKFIQSIKGIGVVYYCRSYWRGGRF